MNLLFCRLFFFMSNWGWFSLRIWVGNRNNAYLFNTYPEDGAHLIKVSLNDLIPREILNRYGKPLAYGYIRGCVEKLELVIPAKIVELFVFLLHFIYDFINVCCCCL